MLVEQILQRAEFDFAGLSQANAVKARAPSDTASGVTVQSFTASVHLAQPRDARLRPHRDLGGGS